MGLWILAKGALGDIGVIHPDTSAGVIFRQGDTIYRLACGEYRGQEKLTRDCADRASAHAYPYSYYVRSLQRAIGVEERFGGESALLRVSRLIERSRREIAADELTPDERDGAMRYLARLEAAQKKLIELKRFVLDALEVVTHFEDGGPYGTPRTVISRSKRVPALDSAMRGG